ncbi:UPF0489 protein C5orf22 [Holothuria leucospilota]|uniref:UPF0489 protein C5orf22 n=1 Tax=Holothuria leucospilota TaxID=206669 RepID=A0A9Q1C9E8_HOLLE|nr:UPF0489 protein C5orf22 [Holothuria leucospilota]
MAEIIPRKKRRLFSIIPVVVVEDHHEVLKHIYRALATRHLPFEGICMVHLDSHPDLQIPSKIPAQDVFNLEKLSCHLSIENWIIPPVFAGHINRLVWMKPPWADQLPEGHRRVVVGEHKTHKTIRINWPDEYYLSDVMYAAEDDMINCKQLDVNIITVKYRTNHEYSKFQTQEQSNRLSYSSEQCEQELQSSSPKTKDSVHSFRNDPVSDKVDTIDKDQAADSKSLLPDTNSKNENEGDNLNSDVVSVIQEAVSCSEAFILDIDLDFFSTQNPFKLEYTPEQYAVLKELYHFEAPKDGSREEVDRSQSKRDKQLKDLHRALAWCLNEKTDNVGNTEKLSDRWLKMQGLIEDLKASSKETLNGELIHMAGETTCDDEDDLPHHVSTEEEIAALVKQVKVILSMQPKPIMVTIARSSEDDYCPKGQVNKIQELVVTMLKELYGEIEIKLDYELKSDVSQKESSNESNIPTS